MSSITDKWVWKSVFNRTNYEVLVAVSNLFLEVIGVAARLCCRARNKPICLPTETYVQYMTPAERGAGERSDQSLVSIDCWERSMIWFVATTHAALTRVTSQSRDLQRLIMLCFSNSLLYRVGQLKWGQLTFLMVICIGKIQWFLAHVNYIQQEVVWCKF